MGIIAFVLLFTSVMNYLLIIVGNLVSRSREMAVRKCYGAEPKNIHAIIFSEALVHVGLGGCSCGCSCVSLQGNHREFPFCSGKYVGA